MDIQFTENSTDVMPTLVGLLSTTRYKFVSIADGYHSHFYCMIPCNEKMDGDWFYKLFKWLGAKTPMPRYDLEPLSLHFYDCKGMHRIIPIVFSQDDVKNIINAVPDNYDGPTTL